MAENLIAEDHLDPPVNQLSAYREWAESSEHTSKRLNPSDVASDNLIAKDNAIDDADGTMDFRDETGNAGGSTDATHPVWTRNATDVVTDSAQYVGLPSDPPETTAFPLVVHSGSHSLDSPAMAPVEIVEKNITSTNEHLESVPTAVHVSSTSDSIHSGSAVRMSQFADNSLPQGLAVADSSKSSGVDEFLSRSVVESNVIAIAHQNGGSATERDAQSVARMSIGEKVSADPHATVIVSSTSVVKEKTVPQDSPASPHHNSSLPVPKTRHKDIPAGSIVTKGMQKDSGTTTRNKILKVEESADIQASKSKGGSKFRSKTTSSRRSTVKIKPGRPMTVLTKDGLTFEVREDPSAACATCGDAMQSVLSSKVNRLRHSASMTQLGPALPSLESRPTPGWFRQRFPAEPLSLRCPVDSFSTYSQPLPITRACSAPAQTPIRRYHLLRQLRAQREMAIQETYLGNPGLDPRLFSQHFITMARDEAPMPGPFAPTFNDIHPSHQTFSILGQVHWQQPDVNLPRCHSPQSWKERKQERHAGKHKPGESAEAHSSESTADRRTSRPKKALKVIPHQVRRVVRTAPSTGSGRRT